MVMMSFLGARAASPRSQDSLRRSALLRRSDRVSLRIIRCVGDLLEARSDVDAQSVVEVGLQHQQLGRLVRIKIEVLMRRAVGLDSQQEHVAFLPVVANAV